MKAVGKNSIAHLNYTLATTYWLSNSHFPNGRWLLDIYIYQQNCSVLIMGQLHETVRRDSLALRTVFRSIYSYQWLRTHLLLSFLRKERSQTHTFHYYSEHQSGEVSFHLTSQTPAAPALCHTDADSNYQTLSCNPRIDWKCSLSTEMTEK